MKCQDHLVKAQICVVTQTSFVLLKNTTKLQNYKALVMDDWMSTEHWWNNNDRAAPKCPSKNLSLYHTNHNKSQAERCRIKPRPLHGTYVKHNVHLSAWIITNMHKSKKNIYIYFGTTVRYSLNSIGYFNHFKIWTIVCDKKFIYATEVPSELTNIDLLQIHYSF